MSGLATILDPRAELEGLVLRHALVLELVTVAAPRALDAGDRDTQDSLCRLDPLGPTLDHVLTVVDHAAPVHGMAWPPNVLWRSAASRLRRHAAMRQDTTRAANGAYNKTDRQARIRCWIPTSEAVSPIGGSHHQDR